VYRYSFPIVRYFNGILFVFTLVFLKCAHYSTDFGTRMIIRSRPVYQRINQQVIAKWDQFHNPELVPIASEVGAFLVPRRTGALAPEQDDRYWLEHILGKILGTGENHAGVVRLPHHYYFLDIIQGLIFL